MTNNKETPANDPRNIKYYLAQSCSFKLLLTDISEGNDEAFAYALAGASYLQVAELLEILNSIRIKLDLSPELKTFEDSTKRAFLID